MNRSGPFDYWKFNRDLAEMGMQSGAIVAMRTMGMMGLWGVKKSEIYDMVIEKPSAFAEAWAHGMKAVMSGAAPDRVLAASLAPIGRKTRSNHSRLAKLGMKLY